MDRWWGQGKKNKSKMSQFSNKLGNKLFLLFSKRSHSSRYFRQMKIHIYELLLLQNGKLEENIYNTDFFI